MSTHTIKGYIIWRQFDFEDRPTIDFTKYEPVQTDHSAEIGLTQALIREHSFEVEVPDDFDPTGDQIAQLQQHKQQLRAKLARELMAIDERISKLQALPMSPAPAQGNS